MIALVLAVTVFMRSLSSPFSVTTTTEIQGLLLGSIQAESLLTTASQQTTANVKISKMATVLGIPIDDTHLVYSAVGKVTAGLDLHNIEVVDFNRETRTVTLRLPATALEINLNPERSQTLANYRNWFGPKAGADIYEEAQRQAYAVMRSQACDEGIFQAATHNAEVEIRAVLQKVGFQEVAFQTTPSRCSAI